jgi:hypothetical protein
MECQSLIPAMLIRIPSFRVARDPPRVSATRERSLRLLVALVLRRFKKDTFDQRLRHFADSLPYLHRRNLVILAAKPGTFAQPWPDPDLDWSQVGPLSARTTNCLRASAWDQDPPTLGEVLSNVTDYKGTGEISPKGSISWSDFDSVKKLTDEFKLQTTRRASKQTRSDAPVNGD